MFLSPFLTLKKTRNPIYFRHSLGDLYSVYLTQYNYFFLHVKMFSSSLFKWLEVTVYILNVQLFIFELFSR